MPVIAGQLQRTGAAAKAAIVAKTFTDAADTYTMDLRSAYEVPALQMLRRSFTYDRTGTGRLTVTDTFAFATEQTFNSALITYGAWEQTGPTELVIRRNREAVKVAIDTGGRPFAISAEAIQEENHRKTQPTRLAITLTGAQLKGTVTFTITPL